MYKVLLVDDERQIRQGLRARINWEEHGFACCGEAADGREALTLIAQEHPDVVITDIRMPNMDGVALLKECSRQGSRPAFIVLSGYDDFPYVKAAIQSGAKDYLLKPVVRKELIDRLIKVREELDARRNEKEEEEQLKRKLNDNLQRLREQFWLQAVRAELDLKDWAAEAEKIGLGELSEQTVPLRFVTLSAQDVRSGRPQPIQDALLLQAVHLMVREHAELWGKQRNALADVFRDPAVPARLHTVFQCANSEKKELEEWLRSEFQQNIERLLRVRVQMGIGNEVRELLDWRKSYVFSLVRWMQQVSDLGEEMSPGSADHDPYVLPPMVEKQLIASLEKEDLAAFSGLIRSIFRIDPPLTPHALFLRALRLLLLFDEFALKWGRPHEETRLLINALPESLWPARHLQDAEEMFIRLGSKLARHVRRSNASGGEEIVRRISEYLHNHYADEEISLSEMARRYHLHVTYLSELFKKTTGKNFSEYITEIRMEKAKEFMKDPALKVSDIAEMTGFSNPNYFSHVFKKSTGMSPNEYRIRIRKN